MLCQQLLGVTPDPVQMIDVVGAIVARRGAGQRDEARLPAAQ
jgi:hypothetical protein